MAINFGASVSTTRSIISREALVEQLKTQQTHVKASAKTADEKQQQHHSRKRKSKRQLESEVKHDFSSELLEKEISQIEEFIRNTKRELTFTVEQKDNQTIINVFDSHTNEIVRKIPLAEIQNATLEFETHKGLLIQTNI